MGARFGHRRKPPAAEPVEIAIAGRLFVLGRLYASRNRHRSSKSKRLLAYDADNPRWPGGKVVYQTETATAPSQGCGLWWADEAGDPVSAD
jgi:hypothetical protein